MNEKSNEKLSLEKQARRKYFEAWRKNNKDKVKKHNKTFWNKQVKKLDK